MILELNTLKNCLKTKCCRKGSLCQVDGHRDKAHSNTNTTQQETFEQGAHIKTKTNFINETDSSNKHHLYK